ncbi:recombinase family protein [Sedimentibacter saalensis]|uniref:DNA invertase Pin-like site-specific DNA recombinase n=1 Tax=Sedimentibacter saalensis TaxID=130788 RepID=A0A562J4Z1_9FIRM|nr:recombinase family protein [Sedimentibacter saalensis]TWH78153.1 DNA invertase Pin-like site-specific DNA recombinase [Sedimentibacter saalensis]
MSNKIYGYIRVSSKEQNTDRQKQALLEYGVDERDIIEDKVSGKDFNRNGYLTLKNSLLRDGDTLVIKELDRLGRNMDMIKNEWQEIQSNGIDIAVLDTPILNTKNKSDLEKKLIANIVFELLAYMAEKERIKIKARQAEGIAIAKSKGLYKGRKKIVNENFKNVYNDWKKGKLTAVKAIEMLEMKKSTFYRRVKEYNHFLGH